MISGFKVTVRVERIVPRENPDQYRPYDLRETLDVGWLVESNTDAATVAKTVLQTVINAMQDGKP